MCGHYRVSVQLAVYGIFGGNSREIFASTPACCTAQTGWCLLIMPSMAGTTHFIGAWWYWNVQGIVVNGLIRDSEAISKMAVGVKALGTHPLKSDKAAADQGQQQVDVVISGCKISPGDWIYADWDGVVVSKKQLQ
eukprot:GHRR01030305.1.p1 GENE.GHRR01030305.1~~GHRR01030305.1.p1  ORF type:complete len:148 (+),score=37.64 GHRR01030305.1:39-446(+)